MTFSPFVWIDINIWRVICRTDIRVLTTVSLLVFLMLCSTQKSKPNPLRIAKNN